MISHFLHSCGLGAVDIDCRLDGSYLPLPKRSSSHPYADIKFPIQKAHTSFSGNGYIAYLPITEKWERNQDGRFERDSI